MVVQFQKIWNIAYKSNNHFLFWSLTALGHCLLLFYKNGSLDIFKISLFALHGGKKKVEQVWNYTEVSLFWVNYPCNIQKEDLT